MKIGFRFFIFGLLIISLTGCSLGASATNASATTPSSAAAAAEATPSVKPALSANLKAGATETANSKPNIILILADDLNADEMQFMPMLKSLIADRGIIFSHYFVPESLCCPSRATLLRGQYPHNTQIVSNDPPLGGFQKFYDLGEDKSDIPVWLQSAGYRTMLAGKYLNGYPPKGQNLYIPPGWTEWYSSVKGDAYGEYNYTLNENGKEVAYGSQPKDYGTDVYVGKTLDFIQRSANGGQPFFIYLAPYAPHAPYTPAPRHANLFPDAKAPQTPNYDEADVSDKPGYIANRALLSKKQKDQIDTAYRKRLQSLQAVDEGIEKIVNTLQANGQLDNTYLFFTSDNGYHLGNHRQILGKVAPYEEELHLAMMVRGPGVPAGKTLDHLVGNLDLAPTWAALAGAKTADFCDGRSLVPLLGNNPSPLAQWRQSLSLEWGADPLKKLAATEAAETTFEDPNGALEPSDQDQEEAKAMAAKVRNKLGIPYFRGVRLQTMSYVEYQTGETELYDIKNDPYQLNNLASKADPKLLAELAARVKALAECKADACRTAEDEVFKLIK
jgi:N-acetylglucosamine-6-sulfatase